MDAQMPGDGELRQRLEAYADHRLRPDPLAMARIRAGLLATAAARRPVAAPARRSRGWRFAGVLLAAAMLLLVAGGATALASAPGGPLYGARLWVETVTLPSDPVARAEAEVQRLQERLAEIEAAGRSGDTNALQAAVSAYQRIVADALPEDASADQTAHLQAMLSHHLDVLESLLKTAPSQALPGLQRAIDRSGQALQRLEGRSSGPGTPPGQGGTPPGQGGTPPGQGGTPPGQGGTPPGQGGTPPGQGGTPPGQGGSSGGSGPAAATSSSSPVPSKTPPGLASPSPAPASPVPSAPASKPSPSPQP